MNTQFLLKRILIDGTLLALFFTLMATITAFINPRIALSDYPDDVKTAVPPRTKKEFRQGIVIGLVSLIGILAVLLWSTWQVKIQNGGTITYWMAFATIFGEVFYMSLFDLFVLDILIFCTWTPKLVVIPGTEGMAGYKDIGIHLKGHATTGNALLIIFSSVLAFVTTFLF
ncbi:MAG: hypothetical protein DWQ04_23565 [Chloroflexi bacterium]|nr:MAG: hypothetical protein DWQ04_23565 [Chloroflexota bacterium]